MPAYTPKPGEIIPTPPKGGSGLSGPRNTDRLMEELIALHRDLIIKLDRFIDSQSGQVAEPVTGPDGVKTVKVRE